MLSSEGESPAAVGPSETQHCAAPAVPPDRWCTKHNGAGVGASSLRNARHWAGSATAPSRCAAPSSSRAASPAALVWSMMHHADRAGSPSWQPAGSPGHKAAHARCVRPPRHGSPGAEPPLHRSWLMAAPVVREGRPIATRRGLLHQLPPLHAAPSKRHHCNTRSWREHAGQTAAVMSSLLRIAGNAGHAPAVPAGRHCCCCCECGRAHAQPHERQLQAQPP